jgi:hypothetical protein
MPNPNPKLDLSAIDSDVLAYVVALRKEAVHHRHRMKEYRDRCHALEAELSALRSAK